MERATVAVIGGSGLYEMEGVTGVEKKRVATPFGDPSDEFVTGDFNGGRVVFLPRHGVGHRIPPGGISYRANIWALKSLGVDRIISISAVGSLKLDVKPRDFVIPDQFYDNTKHRGSTFFDQGPVAHVAMADPYCSSVRRAVAEACRACDVPVHDGGTYICMEGPQFSTRAESAAYRHLGFDVIGMTSATEAKLAREAEMCYATVCLVTDYDCWHEADVTIDMVLANMAANVSNVRAVLTRALETVGEAADCPCRHALAGAIVTSLDAVPAEVLQKLQPILAKYL